MEEIINNLTEKISSYNIFTNLLPGIILCYILKNTTRFSIANGEFLENIFVYYFVGMIASRLGSLVVEKVLASEKIKRICKRQDCFIVIPDYDNYIIASENEPFIKVLKETNSTCRTMVSVCLILIIVKFYDMWFHDILVSLIPVEWLIIIGFNILLFIFICSYRKQSSYVNKRVENYISTTSKN